jgi:hypothetical protein
MWYSIPQRKKNVSFLNNLLIRQPAYIYIYYTIQKDSLAIEQFAHGLLFEVDRKQILWQWPISCLKGILETHTNR